MREKFSIRTFSSDEGLVKERRDYIMHRSTKLLTRKGYDPTSMRELAEVCELSTGTLYHYFGSKEELLYYIIHSATTQQVEYLESFARDLETAEPTMALVQLVRRFFEWHDVNQDITLFTYQETKNLPRNARQDIFDSEGRIHDLFERFLRRGIESGEFNIDDPSLTAHNIMVLGHAWALRRWYVRKYWTIESYTKLQTDAILKAIQAGPAHRAKGKAKVRVQS